MNADSPSSATPPPLSAAMPTFSFAGVRDYADMVNPILVKELRQRFRSRVFVTLFCLLQVAMIFAVIGGIGLSSSGLGFDGGRGLFWTLFSFPIAVFTPLLAIQAFADEKQFQNLEAILITPLSSRQIVLGKWFALMGVAALLVVSVLPYLVTRYFLGGVDLVAEFQMVVLVLVGTSVFTMLGLHISLLCSPVFRLLVSGAALIALMVFWTALLAESWNGFDLDEWQEWLALLTVSGLAIMILLEAASAQVAGHVENHGTPLRIWILVALATAIVCLWQRTGEAVCMILLGLIYAIGAFLPVESVPASSGIYRPFVRKGLPGRVMGWFLFPGWPSGILFSIAAFVIWFAVVLQFQMAGTRVGEGDWFTFASLIGAFFFPAATWHLLKKWVRLPGAGWLFAVHTFQVVITLMLTPFAWVSNLSGVGYGVVVLSGLLPTTQLLMSLDSGWHSRFPEVAPLLFGTTLLSILVLLVYAFIGMRREVAPLVRRAKNASAPLVNDENPAA